MPAQTQRTAAASENGIEVPPVGELLYRFEADLNVTPIGLTPEGIRMTVGFDGEVVTGMLEGARLWGIDPLLMRADGVGVIDAPKTISNGEEAVYEHMRGYCLPPEGLELPAPEVILDPGFSWPDVHFPIHGTSSFRTGLPEYEHLNSALAVVEGWANFVTARLAVEARIVRYSGTVAAAVPA